MSPAEIRAFRQRLNLSQRELGEALGLTDAMRVVQAWEHGHRGGKPYTPTGTALAAMRYLEAILDTLEPDQPAAAIVERLKSALPDELRCRA